MGCRPWAGGPRKGSGWHCPALFRLSVQVLTGKLRPHSQNPSRRPLPGALAAFIDPLRARTCVCVCVWPLCMAWDPEDAEAVGARPGEARCLR